jgi:nucleotide-binding universal stress UspA family protein
MKMKKILVPTDFSDYSSHALDWALQFAPKFDAKITLVHSIEVPDTTISYELVSDFLMKVRAAAEEELAQKAERIPTEYFGTTHILEGTPSEELLKFAESNGYDMIIMGTHGRRGLAHLLLGSTAERIIRTSKIPVLTLRIPEEK